MNRILIVDDRPLNIAILEEVLADDYMLETAESGEQALEVLEHFDADLILLDIMMPGMSGYDVCRAIRSSSRWPGVKIALISGKAMVSERLEGYEAGADDYITKPFDPDELLAKVRVYLRMKSLEEVERIQRETLTMLCHESRTPLVGILGPVQILAAGSITDPAEQQKLFEGILTSGERLHAFFHKALLLSQLKVEQITFEIRVLDLGDVLRSVVEAVAPRARENEVQIDVEGSGPAPVLVERKALERILTAIIDNAVRFSPSGGTVEIRYGQKDDAVELSIRDHGPGIGPEIRDRLFQAFGGDDFANHTEGNGLSLAIAHEVARAWFGGLTYEPAQPHGARFHLRLPVANGDSVGENASVETCN